MRHTLSVIVRADVGEDEIRIAVEGCVTDQSESSLHPILRRAQALDPEAPVILDLTQTQHCEHSAVALLQEAIDDIDPYHRTVTVRETHPSPSCPMLASAESRSDAR